MEPITIVILLVGAAFLVAGGVALAMWDRVLDWSQTNLIPWLEQRWPELARKFRVAFTKLDQVAVALRRRIAEEWKQLRERLLKETVEIRRSSTSKWVVITTSWIVDRLEGMQPKVVKRETVEDVAWDALPEELRAAFIQKDETSREVNVTDVRDREIGEIAA